MREVVIACGSFWMAKTFLFSAGTHSRILITCNSTPRDHHREGTMRERDDMNTYRRQNFCRSKLRLACHAALIRPALVGIVGLAAMPLVYADEVQTQDADTQSVQTFLDRADIRQLPAPLREKLGQLAGRPNTFNPMRAFAEADKPSQLFEYYLLDTKGFQPNIFTTIVPGINDHAIPTAANAANHQLPTIGAVRVVLEPKPGLPTDPEDPEAFIDIFTDISGLFVINNESGWYEGWMIHDLRVPQIAAPRSDGHARFGTITAADAAAIAALGDHHNTPGRRFTTDGKDVRLPNSGDRFPGIQGNLVPLPLSMGAYNCQQQSDCHSYWEFNEYTNWVFPLYELPFTGGVPGTFGAGKQYDLFSVIPGSGPSGVSNNDPPLKLAYGDNPNNPRDPDRGPNASPDDPDRPVTNDEDQKETRLRFIPSGLANEMLLDVFVRPKSFEPGVTSFRKRVLDAYAAEVKRVDANADGVLTFVEADAEEESDGLPNERLYIAPTKFDRFAVTREIDDGFLAPRFAPSQRAYVLSGKLTLVSPSVPASINRDADDR
jgi:hypothetical protein